MRSTASIGHKNDNCNNNPPTPTPSTTTTTPTTTTTATTVTPTPTLLPQLLLACDRPPSSPPRRLHGRFHLAAPLLARRSARRSVRRSARRSARRRRRLAAHGLPSVRWAAPRLAVPRTWRARVLANHPHERRGKLGWPQRRVAVPALQRQLGEDAGPHPARRPSTARRAPRRAGVVRRPR